MTVVALVDKPSVADEIKEGAVEILRKTLAKAESGEFCSILVIARRPDGTWCDERSGVMDFPDMIGRLEIVKQTWIASYLHGET